jgi:hypothetical protein
MPTFAVADFVTAFQTRQACCRALLELSQRQAALISADSYAELFEVLQSKQSLLDHLGQLAEVQQPLREAWPVERDRLPPPDRRRCEAILEETESLLAALLAEEQSGCRLLGERRDAVRRELQSLAFGVQAQSAYESRLPPTACRIDLNL